jgi:multidrug efflux pump
VLAFFAQGVWWLAAAIVSRFTSRCVVCLSDRRAGTAWTMGAILVVSAALYGVLGRGVEFFPEMDPSEIWVDVETPSGSNLDTSDEIVREIEERTKDTPDMENAIANVGTLGVSINDINVGGSVGTRSRVTLDLVEHKHRVHNSRKTLEESRIKLADLSGADIKVDKPEQGPPTGKPVAVRVIGDDFRVLGRISREIQRRIRKVSGLVNLDDDFDEGKPEVRVQVHRVKAAVAGVNTRAIASTVQTAIRGSEASTYRIGEDEYDIRVRLNPESRISVEELGNLTVPDEDGVPIPIRTLADIQTGVGPAAIRRVELRRVVTIEGDVVRAKGRTEDSVRAEVKRILDAMEWPAGYRWEFAGSNEEEDEARRFLQRAFVIAVLLIALVLVTQFDSIILPATILLSVVLSLIGVFWGLILTGTPFGIIMTGVGVISLAGVVVNNAIVLCDFVVQLRGRGQSKTEAVINAGAIRMRPVLLTAVTTVLGLIPLTAGINIGFLDGTFEFGADSSKFWGPMGVAVIAGLTVATVLTLVVVPVMYHSLDELPRAALSFVNRFISARRAPRSVQSDD